MKKGSVPEKRLSEQLDYFLVNSVNSIWQPIYFGKVRLRWWMASKFSITGFFFPHPFSQILHFIVSIGFVPTKKNLKHGDVNEVAWIWPWECFSLLMWIYQIFEGQRLVHNQGPYFKEGLHGSLGCLLSGTELFPQWCPVNWRSWKVNSAGDKVSADRGRLQWWNCPAGSLPGLSARESPLRRNMFGSGLLSGTIDAWQWGGWGWFWWW